jgi:hypothetical protein
VLTGIIFIGTVLTLALVLGDHSRTTTTPADSTAITTQKNEKPVTNRDGTSGTSATGNTCKVTKNILPCTVQVHTNKD